jgi:hypothetical protein
MARTPIDILFDRIDWRCTRCGAKSGTCDCWRKITIRCPHCKRSKQTTVDPTDPPGTMIVESICDRCDNGGNKPEVHYYDAAGRWFDGEKFRKTHR